MMESSRKYSKENPGERQEASTSSAKSPKRPFDVTRQDLAQEQENSPDKRQKASTSSGMDLTRQGSSDLGREYPEMQKQLDQMQSGIEDQIKQVKLELQNNPKMREEVLTQWWETQRENKTLLYQIQQKMTEKPEIRKQITGQWWEMHRQGKIQLDNQRQHDRASLRRGSSSSNREGSSIGDFATLPYKGYEQRKKEELDNSLKAVFQGLDKTLEFCSSSNSELVKSKEHSFTIDALLQMHEKIKDLPEKLRHLDENNQYHLNISGQCKGRVTKTPSDVANSREANRRNVYTL